MKRKTIAAHIPTYNCPDLLMKCVSRLLWVDEIIIADNSTNSDIRNLIADIEHPNVRYIYSAQPDIRIRLTDLRHEMKSDYVLWVCTDEYYTKEAGEQILSHLTRLETLKDGYTMPSRLYRYGKFDCDTAPLLRVFRRDQYFFDMKSMHDEVRINGSIGCIDIYYDHYQLQSIASQANKIFFYAANDARVLPDDNISQIRTDKLSSFRIKMHFLTQILRMCWRTRGLLLKKNASHVDLWKNYEALITVIANDSMPTEEAISREEKAILQSPRKSYPTLLRSSSQSLQQPLPGR